MNTNSQTPVQSDNTQTPLPGNILGDFLFIYTFLGWFVGFEESILYYMTPEEGVLLP